eukprot:6208159-Pleurochrysis_carterae.AAC.2
MPSHLQDWRAAKLVKQRDAGEDDLSRSAIAHLWREGRDHEFFFFFLPREPTRTQQSKRRDQVANLIPAWQFYNKCALTSTMKASEIFRTPSCSFTSQAIRGRA